jgi:hypothetical protein
MATRGLKISNADFYYEGLLLPINDVYIATQDKDNFKKDSDRLVNLQYYQDAELTKRINIDTKTTTINIPPPNSKEEWLAFSIQDAFDIIVSHIIEDNPSWKNKIEIFFKS